MLKRTTGLLLLTILVSLGCSAKKEAPSLTASADTVQAASEYSTQEYENSRNQLDEEYRKIITTANIRIRVEHFDTETASILDLMQQYNSYPSETRINESSRSYTIRVPVENYKPLFEDIKKLGRVLYSSEKNEDVTLKYYDMESRLNTKRELMRTYQSYLRKAEKMEDILATEAKIAELQNDIDSEGSKFITLSNLIDYSTIKLELLGPVSQNTGGRESLGYRAKQLFSNIGEYVSTVLIILLGLVVYGVPSIIILALLYWLLLGKVGVLKKVWRIVAGKRNL
jgi:uncharacterized membrane protein YecN with MAPEG domain